MRVICPKCLAENRIEPERVTLGEVKPECAKCGATLPVSIKSEAVVAPSKGRPAASSPKAAPKAPSKVPQKAPPKPPPLLDFTDEDETAAGGHGAHDGAATPHEASKVLPFKKPEGRDHSPEDPGANTGSGETAGFHEGNVVPFKEAGEAGGGGEAQRLSFHGSSSGLFRMVFVNNLLTALTLGVYHFWAKAKVRKYLYSSTEFMGERFLYTGTGKELFKGWLRAGGVMAIVFGLPEALSRLVHPLFALLTLPMMLFLIPFAIASSRRYRLSRTTWHGVRFSFAGRPLDFVKLYVKGAVLSVLTLGFYSPRFHVEKERFLRGNTRYGTGSFTYTGEARDLQKDFLRALPLTIATFGLYSFWYKARVTRYDWEHTAFGPLRFASTVTGKDMLFFTLGNVALLALTFGAGQPLVAARNIRFVSRHLAATGKVDFATLGQASKEAEAVGEGISDAFDLDAAM